MVMPFTEKMSFRGQTPEPHRKVVGGAQKADCLVADQG